MRKLVMRVCELLVVLLIVSFGVFALLTRMKKDPAIAALGENKPAEAYAQWRQARGLEDPLFTRYFDWLGGALHGDLGNSLIKEESVWGRIGDALPVSLQLALSAMLVGLLVAIPLAMLAASRAGGVIDRIVSGVNFGVLAVPSFLSGLILIMVFVNNLHWFPRTGWVRFSDDPIENLTRYAVLPVLAIALVEIAYFTRVLRNDLVVTLQDDYVLAAKARGMSTWRILFVDALRPSSFSLVTMLGLSLGTLIGSTVIVEYLFNIPGMGSMLTKAIGTGDYPIVMGGVLVIAVIYVVANALIDVVYELLDPRTRRATS